MGHDKKDLEAESNCIVFAFMLSTEEGRAASKSPHYKFGYFLSISRKEFLPISFKIQLLETSHCYHKNMEA
jgi:hypothetical protein